MRFVLVLDATHAHARQLVAALEDGGHEATVTSNAAEAEQLLASGSCDGLVVDTWVAGIDLIKRVHRRSPHRTLISWTATASSAEAADALEAGADEALDGSMSRRELLVRAERAAHREAVRGSGRLEVGPLAIDPARGEVAWDGAAVSLTRREREVLHVLADAAGTAVARETLYRRVWGYTMARGDRSVDVNVKRLRAKLAQVRDDRLQIVTLPGVGYRLDVTAPADEPRAPVVTRL